jgi:hypothetical protein
VGGRPTSDSSATDAVVWRCQQALARIESEVEPIIAEHATNLWQRGARRRVEWPRSDDEDGWVRWSIEGAPVVELRIAPRGPAELLVHDLSLLDPLRRALRTRHVRVRLVG